MDGTNRSGLFSRRLARKYGIVPPMVLYAFWGSRLGRAPTRSDVLDREIPAEDYEWMKHLIRIEMNRSNTNEIGTQTETPTQAAETSTQTDSYVVNMKINREVDGFVCMEEQPEATAELVSKLKQIASQRSNERLPERQRARFDGIVDGIVDSSTDEGNYDQIEAYASNTEFNDSPDEDTPPKRKRKATATARPRGRGKNFRLRTGAE